MRSFWKLICALLIFVTIFSFLQFLVPGIIEYDGYLHEKSAEIIRTSGFIYQFKWLPFSIFHDKYVDLNFLFRVLIIPFSYGDLVFGAKIAAIMFSSLCFFVFYLFLTENKIRIPFFFCLLYLLSSSFLATRFLFTRPVALSIALLIGIVYSLFRKKHIFLGILSGLYVWLYQGFIFGMGIVFVYFLVDYLFSRKADYKLVLYALGGTIAGLVINPYFPNNLYFEYIQLVQVNLFGNLLNYEWRPWGFVDFFKYNVMFIGMLCVGIFYGLKHKKITKNTLFFLFMSLIFLVLTIKSKRMQEYFAPFTVLFFAFSMNHYFEGIYEKKTEIGSGKIQRSIRSVMIGSIAIIAILAFIQFPQVKAQVHEFYFLDDFKAGALWLKDNIPKDSLVFNNAYTFNYLFFYDPEFRYTHGLDLTYSYLYDKERFGRYSDILTGKLNKETNEKLDVDYIIQDYHPDYLFVGKQPQDFELRKYIINHKSNYELVYEDKFVGILKVKK